MFPFDAEVLASSHALYNAAVWPAQVVALAAALAAVWLAVSPQPWRGRALGAILAAGWLWGGAVFFLGHVASLDFLHHVIQVAARQLNHEFDVFRALRVPLLPHPHAPVVHVRNLEAGAHAHPQVAGRRWRLLHLRFSDRGSRGGGGRSGGTGSCRRSKKGGNGCVLDRSWRRRRAFNGGFGQDVVL